MQWRFRLYSVRIWLNCARVLYNSVGIQWRFQQNSDIIRKSYEFLLNYCWNSANSAEIHMTSELCPNFAMKPHWIPTELYKTRAQFSQIRTEHSPNLHCILRFRLVRWAQTLSILLVYHEDTVPTLLLVSISLTLFSIILENKKVNKKYSEWECK